MSAMTAKELLARLQRHYIKPGDPMPGGVFMPEVVLGNRRADALYVGFFASRGKRLVGHELKVSRADWLHELDVPSKAEAWESNCHQWYVVAPDTQIVRIEELPEGWVQGDVVTVGKVRWLIRILDGESVELEGPGAWWRTTVDRLPRKAGR